MCQQLAITERGERLVRAAAAADVRLLADAGFPLVGATRRVAGASLGGVLPAHREHILAPAEQDAEQLDLEAG